MKICLAGIPGIPLGKHNVKDPRLDEAHRLVEAKKKTCVQVDLLGAENMQDAEAIVVSEEGRADLILKDLEFIEIRLGRNPPAAEKAVLKKLQAHLENERFVFDAGLSDEEKQDVAAHSCFVTNKPVMTATPEDIAQPEALILRAFKESGRISFLTVGGKENRAWEIRKNTTAWEAAGAIHSDIQHGFIRAEIISYDDFIQAGGETQAKRAGKLRLETKNYIVQDYDLVNFRFNK
jgi:ribosome-binding ATPase YchF (GTP1/OBG family)